MGQNNSFEQASADRRAGFPALHQTKIFLERKKKQREQRWWEDWHTPCLEQDHSIGGPREGGDVPSFLSSSLMGFFSWSWRQNRGETPPRQLCYLGPRRPVSRFLIKNQQSVDTSGPAWGYTLSRSGFDHLACTEANVENWWGAAQSQRWRWAPGWTPACADLTHGGPPLPPGLGARPLECRTATMQGRGAERKHLNPLRKARNACISFELTNIFCHLKELVLKAEDVIFKKLHFCTSEWSALNIIMPAMYRYMLVYK